VEGEAPKVLISGLGLRSRCSSYTMNGLCTAVRVVEAFKDPNLTYYVSYLLATGALKVRKVNSCFNAGPMGTYTIEKAPHSDGGVAVLQGAVTVYDKTNVAADAEHRQRRKRRSR